MKKASNASVSETNVRTQEQEREFRRLMEGVALHAANLALDKIQATRKTWQEKIIENIEPLRKVVIDAVLGKLQELTFCLLKRLPQSVPAPATQEFTMTKEFLKKEFNIDWLGDNAKKFILDKLCKAEPAGITAVHVLQKNAKLATVFEELGTKTTIGRILWHIKQQSKGQEGILLTNGYANFGFVEVANEKGELEVWAVGFAWYSRFDYWGLEFGPVGHPYDWRAAYQFVSSELS